MMNNELLRHLIATILYRFEKSVKGSTENFGNFSLGHGSRSPKAIVHHMNEVIYATRFFIAHETLPEESIPPLNFKKEISRFKVELNKVDQLLASQSLEMNYSKRLMQGPFSDLLTHIGQIAMLQRLNGDPIKGEDFSSNEMRSRPPKK